MTSQLLNSISAWKLKGFGLLEWQQLNQQFPEVLLLGLNLKTDKITPRMHLTPTYVQPESLWGKPKS